MRRLLHLVVAASLLGAGSAILGSSHAFAANHGPYPSPTDTPTPTGAPTATAAAIVATAEQYVGYPYAYIGDTPQVGFSCIGFAHFVYAQHGIAVPEELGQAYASAPHVDAASLQPGDLVFFQNTYWAGISHVDIYIGNGKMIGADSPTQGVQWDTLSDAYWQNHYLGAARPLASVSDVTTMPSATPSDATATPIPSDGSTTAIPTSTATPAPATPQPGTSTTLAATPAPDKPTTSTIRIGAALSASHNATVYSGPGATYSVIDTLTRDMALMAVRTQGQWVNVSYDGGDQYGWVRGADVKLRVVRQASSVHRSGPNARVASAHRGNSGARHAGAHRGTSGGHSSSPRHASHVLVVTADVLFVRAAPSTHARILRRVHAGDHLRLLKAGNGWDYIAQRDNAHGWVRADWVK